MLDKLRDIRDLLRRGREVFEHDPVVQKAVAYDLMILGEAAGRVSQRTQKANPAVPWSALAAYRNELIHEYGNLALEDTWAFVQRDLRRIEQRLSKVRIISPDK